VPVSVVNVLKKLIIFRGELRQIRIVICTRISRPRNHSLKYREKNCLRPRQDNVEDVKRFGGQGVHNMHCVK
jgi:hypothetical protein